MTAIFAKKVWDFFSITDKKHTKDFTRAGGFKGTAIRPMYAIEKMTEQFGLCGTGWGYSKPEYERVHLDNGQCLVYCTVSIWYQDDKGNRSADIPGVGGDFVVNDVRGTLRPDDEAYKKAFTDALMNAMKHIGMSADIHMGQFDGNKYVQPDMNRLADNKDVQQDMRDLGYDPVKVSERLFQGLDKLSDLDGLVQWKNENVRDYNTLPEPYKTEVKNKYSTLKIYFTDKQNGVT